MPKINQIQGNKSKTKEENPKSFNTSIFCNDKKLCWEEQSYNILVRIKVIKSHELV